MAKFLAYTNKDGESQYVNVEDISALLVHDDGDTDHPLTAICCCSAPNCALIAKGAPTNIIHGCIVEL